MLTQYRKVSDIVLGDNPPLGYVPLPDNHGPEIQPVQVRQVIHYKNTAFLESPTVTKRTSLDTKYMFYTTLSTYIPTNQQLYLYSLPKVSCRDHKVHVCVVRGEM